MCRSVGLYHHSLLSPVSHWKEPSPPCVCERPAGLFVSLVIDCECEGSDLLRVAVRAPSKCTRAWQEEDQSAAGLLVDQVGAEPTLKTSGGGGF
jgi:hypothetical protein